MVYRNRLDPEVDNIYLDCGMVPQFLEHALIIIADDRPSYLKIIHQKDSIGIPKNIRYYLSSLAPIPVDNSGSRFYLWLRNDTRISSCRVAFTVKHSIEYLTQISFFWSNYSMCAIHFLETFYMFYIYLNIGCTLLYEMRKASATLFVISLSIAG